MRSFALVILAAAALAVVPARAIGAVTDGHLDAEYGAALAVQTNQYSLGGSAPRGNFVDHSELDALHAFVSDDQVLHVFVAGNLRDWIGNVEPSPAYDNLFLFIDTQPGGQNVLRADNPQPYGLQAQAGLAFDADFSPDWALVAWAPNMMGSPTFDLYGFYAALTAAGGTGYDLGHDDGSAPGTLAGGTNPYDIRLAIDNTSPGVLGPRCGTGVGSGVTSGLEWAIPLAAIGNPTGCIRLMVYACYENVFLENQVLPPVPPGTCMLGSPSGVSFASLAGEQFTSLCGVGVPVRRSTWGSLKSAYR